MKHIRGRTYLEGANESEGGRGVYDSKEPGLRESKAVRSVSGGARVGKCYLRADLGVCPPVTVIRDSLLSFVSYRLMS
jgi:hypothetical protein